MRFDFWFFETRQVLDSRSRSLLKIWIPTMWLVDKRGLA